MIDIAALVKCYYCGKHFDRDKEPYTQVGKRRYAHQSCALKDYDDYDETKTETPAKELTKEEKDLLGLEDYVKKILKEPYVNAKVKKQIKEFKKEYGYSYSGMHKSLVWFYEIKGHSTANAAGGIGILPFIYKDAQEFFYNYYVAKLKNSEKSQADFHPSTKEITIDAPRRIQKKKKIFDMGD